jgi:hypothetical protein
MDGAYPYMSDIILKENHPMTILAKFGWIWFSGFRGESLAYTTDNRQTDNGRQVMATGQVS